MWRPSHRLLGALSAFGGVLMLVATIPTRWYGPTPTDSYVFEPPRYSALWVERTVVPALAVLAVLLALAGLLALFDRDRERMARWHRWLAVVAVMGAAITALATVFLVSTVGGGTAPDPTGALNAIVAAGFALLGTLLLVPGLLAWGVGYLRDGRPLVGAALAGGPASSLATLATGVGLGVEFGDLGALPVVFPLAVATVVVGYDLSSRAE